jgi:DNA-binding transcriptional LysR family regulator
VERLEAGSLDLGVCLKPRDASRLDCHALFEDELVFLTSPRHPWRKEPPKPKDFGKETYIISSRNSSTFEMIQEYFHRLGARPRSFIELGNTEAIKELVKLGLGVAMVAAWTARTEIKARELCPLPLPRAKVKRQWVVAHLKERPVTLAERTFMSLCQEVGADLNALRGGAL